MFPFLKLGIFKILEMLIWFFFFEKTSKESIQKNYMLEIVNYIFILLYIISIKVVQLFCQVYEQFRPVVKCINKKT